MDIPSVKNIFPPEDERLLRDIFSFLDWDKDEYVTADALGPALSMFKNTACTMEDIKRILEEHNLTARDLMDWPTFLSATKMAISIETVGVLDVIKAFRKFDTEGRGHLHISRIKMILTGQGEVMSEEEADMILQHVPRDVDGNVNYGEFVEKCMDMITTDPGRPH